MARELQTETLFDIAPDGAFVIAPDEQVATLDLRDPNVWQEGVGPLLSQGERAMIAVGSTEVNVAERAGHLTLALTTLSKANRDRGFVKASQSPNHRAEVEAWGGVRTDDVASELDYRSLEGDRRARYEFFAANGLGYLAVRPSDRLSGSERLARNHVDGMWANFRTTYGGTGRVAVRQRNDYKKQLAEYTGVAESRS